MAGPGECARGAEGDELARDDLVEVGVERVVVLRVLGVKLVMSMRPQRLGALGDGRASQPSLMARYMPLQQSRRDKSKSEG